MHIKDVSDKGIISASPTGRFPKPDVKTGPIAVGDAVEAVFPDDGEWYAAVVTKALKKECEVKCDDPDGGPESSKVKLDDIKHFAPKVANLPDEWPDGKIDHTAELKTSIYRQSVYQRKCVKITKAPTPPRLNCTSKVAAIRVAQRKMRGGQT